MIQQLSTGLRALLDDPPTAPPAPLTRMLCPAMTELADGVVYSRSGLTYQAGVLEKAGLITRAPSPEDERATLVTITDDGRALLGRVMPGHIQVTRGPACLVPTRD